MEEIWWHGIVCIKTDSEKYYIFPLYAELMRKEAMQYKGTP